MSARDYQPVDKYTLLCSEINLCYDPIGAGKVPGWYVGIIRSWKISVRGVSRRESRVGGGVELQVRNFNGCPVIN